MIAIVHRLRAVAGTANGEADEREFQIVADERARVAAGDGGERIGGDGVDDVGGLIDGAQEFEALDAADFRGLVAAAADELFAVGGEGHGQHPITVEINGFHRRLLLDGNEMHRAVRAAERDGLAVGREVALEQSVLAHAPLRLAFAIRGIEKNHAAKILRRTTRDGEAFAVGAELDVRDQIKIRGDAARRGVGGVHIEEHDFAAHGDGGELAIGTERHARDRGGEGVGGGNQHRRRFVFGRGVDLGTLRDPVAEQLHFRGGERRFVLRHFRRIAGDLFEEQTFLRVTCDEQRAVFAALAQRGGVVESQAALCFRLGMATDAMAFEDGPDVVLVTHVGGTRE